MNMLSLISALFVVLLDNLASQGCHETLFSKVHGRYLSNKVISTLVTRSEQECIMICSSEAKCASVNYKTSGENIGLCELNNGILSQNDGLARPEFIYIGVVSRTCQKHLLFSQETKQCIFPLSCKDLWTENKESSNGVYNMRTEGSSSDYPVYCHMDEIPGCGGRGWTLVMKLDGKKDTFKYDSPYWSDKNTYQVKEGLEGLTEKETKLQSYWNTPFTKLCVGMRFNGSTNWIEINHTANSLHGVIADGVYRPTNARRKTWKSLVIGSSLQHNCNKEGFNIVIQERLDYKVNVRLGIVANNEDDCYTCDSMIGFGADFQACTLPPINTTTGNLTPCQPNDNGVKKTATLGYIFVN